MAVAYNLHNKLIIKGFTEFPYLVAYRGIILEESTAKNVHHRIKVVSKSNFDFVTFY